MISTDEGQHPGNRRKHPRRPWRYRLVSYIERKLYERKTKKQQESPTDRAARIASLATVWMAIFTLVLVLVGIGTYFILKNQLYEMQTGGHDTHELADAAKKQADRTKDLVDRMKDQADQTKVIADQAVIQAETGKRLAQNAVDALVNTRTSFQSEQRAWVGVQQVAPRNITETAPWRVSVIFSNSGRTTARKVQTSIRYQTSNIPITGPSPEQVRQFTFRDAQSIAPQCRYDLEVGNGPPAQAYSTSQTQGSRTLMSQFQDIRNGRLFLYYFGILKYDDGFGKIRETQFCIYLADPASGEAGFCDGFNDLN